MKISNGSKVLIKIHNARLCTIDGRDYWIAAFHDAKTGKMLMPTLNVEGAQNIGGFDSLDEAKSWARGEAKARGLGAIIEVAP